MTDKPTFHLHQEPIIEVGQKYIVRPAIPEDAHSVLKDLREDDRFEWEMSVVGGAEGNLEASIQMAGECYSLIQKSDGSAHVIFGVTRSGDPPLTWMLGTNQGQADAWWTFQVCREHEFADKFMDRWPDTACYSAPHNVTHHRWLEWIGYKKVGLAKWGPYRHTFYLFVLRRPGVNLCVRQQSLPSPV